MIKSSVLKRLAYEVQTNLFVTFHGVRFYLFLRMLLLDSLENEQHEPDSVTLDFIKFNKVRQQQVFMALTLSEA